MDYLYESSTIGDILFLSWGFGASMASISGSAKQLFAVKVMICKVLGRHGRIGRVFAAGRVRWRLGLPLVRRIGELTDKNLMDVGDVLHDELEFVKSRRRILAVPFTAQTAGPLKRLRESPRQKLREYCEEVHQLETPLSALCLSGGGIRSAAFALGVAQGLATRGLLHRFDYLSTVSGGGYLGSFLTAWVQRAGYVEVVDELAGKSGIKELSPLQYLRRYTSYLTPSKGPFTPDTLTVVAHYFRNLLLNWLIAIPLALAAMILVKIFLSVVWSIPATSFAVWGFGLAAIALTGLATMDSLRQRPGWESDLYGSFKFKLYEQWPLFLGGIAVSCAALKFYQLPHVGPDWAEGKIAKLLHLDQVGAALAGVAIIVASIMFISWMVAFFIARPPNSRQRSTRENVRSSLPRAVWTLVSFTLSGAITGVALGGLLYGASTLSDPQVLAIVLMSFGPPIVVAAYFAGEMFHVGATSYIKWGDGEREWLATAAGFHARLAISWMIISLVVLVGSFIVIDFYRGGPITSLTGGGLTWLTSTGGVSGLIVLFLGKASSTAAVMRERFDTWMNLGATLILAIAAPVFVVILASFLSAVVDLTVARKSLLFPFQSRLFQTQDPNSIDAVNVFFNQFHQDVLWPLTLFLMAAAGICIAASFAINTNRFSLHGLYRNRLIRAFLGASRITDVRRRPNPLTGFDEKDNVPLSELWPQRRMPGLIPPNFLVVNCSLNVLATTELSWQERKALAFTITPRSAGAGALDRRRGYFRRAAEYGRSISLGSAMTISGAAVSPNMGYHSSTALSLLLTFFNVRLGAWLGNPGPRGKSVYAKQGPVFSARPLIREALGLTTEDERYVYLSDGGHFENLGLYEMVRRRCKCIIISDAGCDPSMAFEDLGNAVRKISIDLGVKITFDSLQIGTRTAPTGVATAVATIVYPEAHEAPGRLLYLKPSYQGGEPASVRSYAAANPAFPHEPTSDQLFGESQFEAYRALGEYVVETAAESTSWNYSNIETFIDDAARTVARRAKVHSGK